jgi:hypothetical protein
MAKKSSNSGKIIQFMGNLIDKSFIIYQVSHEYHGKVSRKSRFVILGTLHCRHPASGKGFWRHNSRSGGM